VAAIRIGIIDSGVNPSHPHVGEQSIAAGVRIGLYQNTPNDHLDYLGHGTAVAGAILSHCPDAHLYIAKVFDKTLNTRVEVIIRAIEWCVEQGVDAINLSLGTHNPAHRALFEPWAARTSLITAAGSLPGGLPNVWTVHEDNSLARDAWKRGNDPFLVYASGRPRPIPGRDESDNLGGVSFAVANFTGLAAQAGLFDSYLGQHRTGSRTADPADS
jgi:subtilisin family serine protease